MTTLRGQGQASIMVTQDVKAELVRRAKKADKALYEYVASLVEPEGGGSQGSYLSRDKTRELNMSVMSEKIERLTYALGLNTEKLRAVEACVARYTTFNDEKHLVMLKDKLQTDLEAQRVKELNEAQGELNLNTGSV